MSIQVEMPIIKWWVAMNPSRDWYAFVDKPMLTTIGWTPSDMPWSVIDLKVTGFTGDWKDSLHQWNGKEWVKA